jgi:hypothetical protein
MNAVKFDLNAYLWDDSNLHPDFAASFKRRRADGSYWKDAWAGRLPIRQVKPIECADGLTMSVQASETHYCSPRSNLGPYTEVEVGFPSQLVEELMEYAESPSTPTDTVYAYVPVTVVEAVIEKHGGLKQQ